jgi:transcriptional regulator with XRE-family HTH domain
MIMKNSKQLDGALAKVFKKGRIKSNKTQGEVSDILGYSSPQFLSNFERGLCTMPLEKLKKMIDIYDLDGEEVVRLIIDIQNKYVRSELINKSKRRSS